MSIELKIYKDRDWFPGTPNCEVRGGVRGNQIDYRIVISYALRNYLVTLEKEGNNTEGDCDNNGLSELLELQNGLSNYEYYQEDDFIELIPFTTERQSRGFVIVDQSDGIHPFLLYPDDTPPNDKIERLEVFKTSLDEVIKKYTDIIKFFRNKKDETWTNTFHSDFGIEVNLGDQRQLFSPYNDYQVFA